MIWILAGLGIFRSFRIYQGFKNARVTQGSSKDVSSQTLDRIPNTPEYSRVLNMSGLHKVLNKTLQYRCLIGL